MGVFLSVFFFGFFFKKILLPNCHYLFPVCKLANIVCHCTPTNVVFCFVVCVQSVILVGVHIYIVNVRCLWERRGCNGLIPTHFALKLIIIIKYIYICSALEPLSRCEPSNYQLYVHYATNVSNPITLHQQWHGHFPLVQERLDNRTDYVIRLAQLIYVMT